MYKTIIKNLDKIWRWVKNVSTLDYGDIGKNFILSIVFLVLVFFSTNINLIISEPWFILVIIMLVLLMLGLAHVITLFITRYEEKQEKDSIKYRTLAHEEICDSLKSTMHALNADRIYIEELHNSVSNLAGLGFLKYTMTYEFVNQDKELPAAYLSQEHKDVQATLYNLPIILKRIAYVDGTTDELRTYDERYASQMAQAGDKYCAFVLLSGLRERPITGWICATWRDLNDVPDGKTMKEEMANLAKVIRPIINLARQ